MMIQNHSSLGLLQVLLKQRSKEPEFESNLNLNLIFEDTSDSKMDYSYSEARHLPEFREINFRHKNARFYFNNRRLLY
jgi:hypothetical protein